MYIFPRLRFMAHARVVTEDNTFNPSTPYAVSRAAADMSLQSFFAAYDFPVVTTRAVMFLVLDSSYTELFHGRFCSFC